MLGQASISDNEKEYDPLVPVEHERVNHGRGTLRLDIGVQRQQIAGVVGAFERGEVTEGFRDEAVRTRSGASWWPMKLT